MKKFKAKLEKAGEKDAWVVLYMPFSVEKEFGTKGRLSVNVSLNGKPFQTSIFPTGDGTHHLMVNKTMQKAIDGKPGDTVQVQLERRG